MDSGEDGAQVNYYLFRIQKKSVLWSFLFRAVYACNNAFFYFLNKINNIETETINNSLIAVKRNVTRETIAPCDERRRFTWGFLRHREKMFTARYLNSFLISLTINSIIEI